MALRDIGSVIGCFLSFLYMTIYTEYICIYHIYTEFFRIKNAQMRPNYFQLHNWIPPPTFLKHFLLFTEL